MRPPKPALVFVRHLALVLASAALGCATGDSEPFGSSDAGAHTSPEAALVDLPPLDEGDDAGADDALPDDDALPSLGDPVDAEDASAPAPSFDAGPEGACVGPLAPGDLAIVELMIESVSGAGDYGEWVEVQSTRDCALDIVGLHGECPVGAKVATFDLQEDLWLPPRGSFLVADSSDPAIEHDLPGALVKWSGVSSDVLRNEGATVTLIANGAIVDSVTWPALKLVVGASLAFPDGCPETVRSDWAKWETSSASWFPGFFGTPNAPNVDVRCPDTLELDR